MKIKTWIKYEEGYLPPRCRKLRYKMCEEYVNINLSETTLAELQLAFEDLSYSGAGKIFLYKGKLWKKTSIRDICAGGEDEYRYHTPLEALAWWNEDGSKYFRYGYGSYHGEEYTKKAALKQARSDMRRFLLVDGELYSRTTEPRYCIYTFGLGHNHGGTSLSVDYRYNPNISKTRYFSALQGHEAVSEANRIAQMRGDSDYVGKFRADIKVYMPELVKVNPKRQHGDGDSLLNTFDEIAMNAPSAFIAGVLCMATVSSEIRNGGSNDNEKGI